jgi:glycosyltransferase involved in cell wall biosynthesis
MMTVYPLNIGEAEPGEIVSAADERRLTVALPFKYQETWVGGLYYVRNVVSALALLPADARPTLLVVDADGRGLDYLREETGYADLRRAELPPRGFGALLDAFSWPAASKFPTIDVVLMGSLPGLEHRAVQWIPDFQEERFPAFFRAGEIHARRKIYSKMLAKHRHVMVSSADVKSDLELYYGKMQNRVHVVRFASFADNECAKATPSDLRSRFGLPPRFFICTNQIWRHKNHGVVLRAMAECASAGEAPTIVFTGREHDYRHREYAPSIKALARELGVGEQARFLGFLPRPDQLGLMAAAIAVVQPSLCEGWSHSVEDAKALGKHVLASDIAVHREQLDRNADFFAPEHAHALSGLLRRYADSDPWVRPLAYERNRQDFANSLLRMLREVAASPGGPRS